MVRLAGRHRQHRQSHPHKSPLSLPDRDIAEKGPLALDHYQMPNPTAPALTRRFSPSVSQTRATSSFTVSLSRRGGSALAHQFEAA